jgi:hypothetical protein
MRIFAASPRSLDPEEEILRLRAYAEKLRADIRTFRSEGRAEWWIRDRESSLAFTLSLLRGAEERVTWSRSA